MGETGTQYRYDNVFLCTLILPNRLPTKDHPHTTNQTRPNQITMAPHEHMVVSIASSNIEDDCNDSLFGLLSDDDFVVKVGGDEAQSVEDEDDAFTSLEDTMDNFLRLAQLFENDEIDSDVLRGAFASVYDESLVATITKGPDTDETMDLDYESMFELVSAADSEGFRLIEMDLHPESDNTFRYTVQSTNGGVYGFAMGIATVGTNGKIVKSRRLAMSVLEDKVRDNLIAMFGSFTGTGEVPCNFRQLVAKTFDKSLVVATLDGSMHFDEFYDRLLDLHEDAVKAELLKAKRHEVGMEISFRIFTSSFDYTVNALVMCEFGKVVRMQPLDNCRWFERIFCRHGGEDVSGRVPVSFFPQYKTMAEVVNALPEQVEGLLLADGTDIKPTRQERHLVKVSMTPCQSPVPSSVSDDSIPRPMKKNSPGRSGSSSKPQEGKSSSCLSDDRPHGFQLRTHEGDVYARGAHVFCHQEASKTKRFILCGGDEQPIACCYRVDKAKDASYYIHGTDPLLEDDEPIAEEDDVEYFPWFQIVSTSGSTGNAVLRQRVLEVQVWNGSTFESLWKISAGAASFASLRGLELTDQDFVLHTDEGVVLSVMSNRACRNQESGWDLTFAPGVDPALGLMLGTVVDEFSTRQQ